MSLNQSSKAAKRCSLCQKLKPKSDFHRNRCYADGFTTRCKPCANEVSRQWYLSNKEQARARQKEWDKKNKERMSIWYRQWRERNRDKVRASQIKHAILRKDRRAESSRNYTRKSKGFTIALVDSLLIAQDNSCAICLVPFTNRSFHADHDHRAGRPRGLLCQSCNHGLGRFKDSLQFLLNAISYLEKYTALEARQDVVESVLKGVKG